MEVFCINLTRRPDRWEQFSKKIKAKRWPAVDGEKVKPPSWWKTQPAAWACYRSHFTLIEHCLSEGYDDVMIFEDDAYPTGYEWSPPENWSWCYYGGQHLVSPVNCGEYYIGLDINRMHAYRMRRNILEVVYEALCKTDWSTRHHIDHYLGSLHPWHEVVTPTRWVYGQIAGKSDINGKSYSNRTWIGHRSSVDRGSQPRR